MKTSRFSKLFTLLLAAAMVLSMVPFAGSADTTHTVSFDMGGHFGDIPSQQVVHGGHATKPTQINYGDKAPDYATTGLYFRGWYVAKPTASTTYQDNCYEVARGGQIFDFADTVINQDTVVYAWYEGFPELYCYDLTLGGQGGGTFKSLTPCMRDPYESTGYHQAIAILGAGMASTAEPNAGNHFVGWSTSNSVDDIVNTDKEHTFIFTPKLKLYALFADGVSVEKPKLSLASGTYAPGQEVSITCETDGAKIYYTTDGSDPTDASTLYTGPVTISKTTTLKAIGIKQGLVDSSIAEATYTITAGTITASATGYNGAYDGKAHGITVSVTDPASGAVVKYGKTAGTYDLDASPTITSVSESPLTVYYKVTAAGCDDLTGSATVTITPADISVTKAPAAVSGLTATGSPQALVTAGAATGGNLMYATGKNSTGAPASGWSASIPTGTEKGTYYVWWKAVAANANYKDKDPACLTVVIADAGTEEDPGEMADQVTFSGGVYQLNHKDLTAMFIRPVNKKAKKLTIPATVPANGRTYRVTSIKAKACMKMKKLTSVIIGANVTKIGASAFEGCVKLKTVTLRCAKMKKGGFGSKCFRNIKAKATFKVPKKMISKYRKWIIKKGKAPATIRVKKGK